MEQRLAFTIEDDRTTDTRTYRRVFIAREEAVEDWANQFLPQDPPAVTSKLELARVIQPDGTATAYNPARLPAVSDPDSGDSSGVSMVFLPNARAGCVIEISYRTQAVLNASLPHVSEVLPVQRDVPVLQTSLEVRVPAKGTYHVALNHLPDAKAEESVGNGRHVYRWQLGPIPAAESLPGDPPASQWMAAVAVSSLPSWDEFAVWFRRIAQGSDLIDDTVRKTAGELGNGATDRVDRIRRSFEFVSALRYVAIECGVHGFRPRTPARVLANRYGDCKDKANLLVALLRCQNIPAELRVAQPWVGDRREFPELAVQPRHLLRAARAGSRAAGRPVARLHRQRDALRLRAAGRLRPGGAGVRPGQGRISRRWPTARARCRRSATNGNSIRTTRAAGAAVSIAPPRVWPTTACAGCFAG